MLHSYSPRLQLSSSIILWYDCIVVNAVRTKILNFIIFGASMIAVVAGLKAMNWVPSALQEGLLRRYSSIEEVKERLKLSRIYAPAYYPQCLKWPPVTIAAQKRPYTAVVMEFVQKEMTDVCLVISQTELGRRPPEEKIVLSTVRQSVRYRLKGRDMLLEVGSCKDNAQCSRISWEEDGYRIVVSSRSTPVDLVRIAESMIPPAD